MMHLIEQVCAPSRSDPEYNSIFSIHGCQKSWNIYGENYLGIDKNNKLLLSKVQHLFLMSYKTFYRKDSHLLSYYL